MTKCAECTLHGCELNDMEKTMKDCPSKETELQKQAQALYREKENLQIAHTASVVEAEGYGSLCRLEEIMLFSKKNGFQKLGLVFCIGLAKEARVVEKILTYNGFEVVSAACKNGAVPKSHIDVTDAETLSGNCGEIMCNPIGQALLMNSEKTQLNIILGLCVGHDTLALKYLEAPATILAVKDRVTGHNPLAAVYVAESYYKKRFFPPKDGEK